MKNLLVKAASVFVIFVLSACNTTKDSLDIASPFYSEQDFINDCTGFILSGNTERFCNLYQAKQDLFKDALVKVHSIYRKNMLERAGYFQQQNNYFQAMFCLQQAEIFQEKPMLPAGETVLKTMQPSSYPALRQYYDIKNKTIQPPKPVIPMLQFFRTLTVQVHLSTSIDGPFNVARFWKDTFRSSGIIVTKDFVLTTYRTIEESFHENTKHSTVTVVDAEQNTREAELYSWDSLLNIALLKVKKPFPIDFSVLSYFGSSEKLPVGTDMYIISNLEDNLNSVTKGIVSAKNRKANEFGTWLQIDAQADYGSAGSIVAGSDGLIYGMHMASLPGNSYSFAIPSDALLQVLDLLIQGNNPAHATLGLLLYPRPKTGLQEKIQVMHVFDFSCVADRIKPDSSEEYISAINGQKVKNTTQAQLLLETLDAGGICRLDLEQGASENTIVRTVFTVLTKRMPSMIYHAFRNKDYNNSLDPLFGLQIYTATERKGDYIYIYTKCSQIRPGSIADCMGVRVGEQIGIIQNEYINKTRIFHFFHAPLNTVINEQNLDQYYLELEVSEYHEDLL